MSGKNSGPSLKIYVLITLAFLLFTMIAPMAEASSDKFVAVSCGLANVMALREDGTVWTWGRICWIYDNGSGGWYDQTTPVQVPIENIIAISSGLEHSVALKNDGTVWAWGNNYHGMLGDGTQKSEPLTPVRVVDLNNVVAISAGNGYTVAIRNDGTVWAWGLNNKYQIGDETREDRSAPVQVKGLTNVVAIKGAAIAIKNDGTVWSWRPGLLGVDESNESQMVLFRSYNSIPFQIPELKNVKDIDTNIYHTVFVKEDGTVWNWGDSSLGTLGDGRGLIETKAPFISIPVQAQSLTDVKSVLSTSMALKNDGTVWVWGYNVRGRHGDGKSYDAKAAPVQVSDLSGVIAIDSWESNTMFVKDDGSIWVCGANSCGQIGDGTRSDSQLPPPGCFEEDKLVPVRVMGPQTTTPTEQAQSDTPSPGATSSPAPSQSDGFDLTTVAMLIGLAIAGSLAYSAIGKK